MPDMKNARGWILIIGIFAIVAYGMFSVVRAVRETAQSGLEPINEITSNLSTQVAEFLHPTPTIIPDPVTIVNEIRTLARLETIQYTVEKVITAETGQGPFGFLFGDRLLFIAHGMVIAGIDLAKLDQSDLWMVGEVLYVNLPEPEVFIATLDNDQSYVYHRDTGVLTHGDVHLETAARQVAESEIENAALEDGILALARQNAEHYLYRLLRDLGYPEVIFVGETPTPD
jgi:hypothetical protein